MDISLYLSIEPHMSNGMSTFQMDNFVINESITPYRKLRQIVVEMRARLENITSMGFDIEELQIKKAKAEHDHSVCTDGKYAVQLLEVQIRRYDFELNRKQSILDQQKAEVQFFQTQLEKLAAAHPGGQEQLVKDLQDPDFHLLNEAHFWTHKLARGVQSDMVNYGTVSKGVLEAMLNLPADQQEQILLLGTGGALATQLALGGKRDQALIEQDR